MSKNKTLKKRNAVDFTLLMVTLLLVFIGIIMVFSASWPVAMQEHNDSFLFLKKQIFTASLGLFGLLVTMNINYKTWKKYGLLLFALSLILGLLVFTPLGKEFKGARRWLDLGFITFMPSDFIKIGAIIFLSRFLANKKNMVSTFKQGTVPSLLIIGLASGMIYLQKDFGTTITLAMTLMSIFFIAGINLLHLFAMLGAAGGLGYLAFQGEENAYRMVRFTAFLDPFADKLGSGYQAVQSLYALGSGGIFGLGLGKSRQKFFYMPEAYNDFIFSIIGEELGFIGSFIVILLFLILIYRGIKIALNIEDKFGCYLATGITALITIQTLIHIAVVTSSIPTTGITLPFVSYGGTSLIVYMSAMGILLNISRHAKLNRS